MFIAIEGIDGSGKATQAALLSANAASCGLKTASFSFPGYGKNAFANAVGKYLNGEFGDINAMPAYLIAILFAGDRFMARKDLLEAVGKVDLVVSDRYVASNLAHQGAKLPPEQWEEFFTFVCSVEYGTYQLPAPDVSIYLDMPVKTARCMIAQRKQRSHTALKEDIHEKDEPYLERCAKVYHYLIDHDIVGPWCRIACATSDGFPLPAEKVGEAIWKVVEERQVVSL